MLLNSQNLRTLGIGFNGSFQRGITMHEAQWQRIATRVPSGTAKNEYGWLGQIPNVREWLGDRVAQAVAAHDYTIKNRDWEVTIEVDRNDIQDDNIGVYGPLFEQMGMSTAAHPDQLAFEALAGGFASVGYDGQFFFDTDHPVLDKDGAEQSVANTDGGAGTAWFLIDDRRALKPILFQVRQEPNFVRKDRTEDDNVFNRRKFIYGSDSRDNVGYGFWQFAWGSKQTLDKANYRVGREALMAMKGDYGRPIGVMPRLMVVPPALEGEGLEILNAERDAAGATNVYKGTAELLVVPWLA